MEVQSDRPQRRRVWGVGVKDFRELKVWQRAHQLTLAIYQITAKFRREESYGLTALMRRASSSIGANIAEGCGRDGDAELNRFCSIEVKRMLTGLAQKLKAVG